MGTDHPEVTSQEGQPMNGDVTDIKPGLTFENTILEGVGQFGPYQRWVFALLTMTDIPAGMAMLYFIFSNANPGTRCSLYEGNQTFSNNYSIGNNIACQMNETGPNCVEFEFDDKYTSIITEWDLVCDKTFVPKLTITVQFIGLVIGSAVGGQLADSYGRRPCAIAFLTLLLVTQTLVGVANSWELFAILRGCVGVFAGGTLGINFVTPMEFVGPKWRPFCGCLGVYEVGHTAMCLFAYLLKDWRHLSFITGAICVPLIFAIAFFVPESPRWLIQKGKFEEAERVITKMAKFNKKPVPDLSVLQELQFRDAENQEELARYNYLDLFRTKTYAIRSCVILFIWFSASEFYYGVIIQISVFTGDIYVNALVSAVLGLPADWTAIFVASKMGRKKGFLVYGAVGIICMILIIVFNATGHVKTNPALVTGFALTGKTGITGLWVIAAVYTSELYPTVMRNIGFGAANAASRVGGMVAPQFAMLGLAFHWTIPYIIHGVLAILSAVLELVFLPETNKKPLPEDPPKKKKKAKKEDDVWFGSAPLWPIPVGSALSLQLKEEAEKQKRISDSQQLYSSVSTTDTCGRDRQTTSL